MQPIASRSPFTPITSAIDAARGFFRGLLTAQWASRDLARYHAMSDAELALHDMTRDEIADKVVNRYLK